ncbi:MAG: L,D-transpeptidase [Armatimonadota bacterium]
MLRFPVGIFAGTILLGAAPALCGRASSQRLFALYKSPLEHAMARPVPLRVVIPPKPFLALQFPIQGDEVIEGERIGIRWLSSRDVKQIRLYYYGQACPVGGKPRGKFDGFITQLVRNEGDVQWKVPWMDGLKFRLRIAGFDARGRRLAEDEQTVGFRPRVMSDVEPTCIVVDRAHQRLYYQRDGQILRMHVVSTARRGYVTPRMEPGGRWRGRAVGRVFAKRVWAWSRAYQCPMPFWMAITSSGSHGIHAATRQAQRFLGRPASHGCIRQHENDAKALFELVKPGTAVYVY